MERNERLSASDISKIIKACKQSGVKRLCYLGLEIELQSTEPEVVEVVAQPEQMQIFPETEPQEQDEEEFREFIESQMLIDDPLALEEMIMQGDNEA